MIGALIAFGLGLAFNTGTEDAKYEIMVYCVVGLIAGSTLGRLVHKLRR